MGLLDLFRRGGLRPVKGQGPGGHAFASATLGAGSVDAALKVPKSGADWVRKAWEFYDVVPEMRLVVNFRATSLSKVQLEIARVEGSTTEVVNTPQTDQVLEQLFGGVDHHANALSRMAQHLTIPGGTYNIILDWGDHEEWLIVPPDHLDLGNYYTRVNEQGQREQSGRVSFTHPNTGDRITVDISKQKINLCRIWQPHPHNFWEDDSPTRGAIPTLEKISYLDAVIKSAARSRLVGAGVWFLPQELSLPAASATNDPLEKQELFKKTMYEAMTEAIKNPDSAASRAPILAWVPGDLLDKIQNPFNFWSEFDKAVNDMRDTEIRRYATGQPVPTEKISGLEQTNHWTDWHLAEEDIKLDIGPLAQLICDAVTSWLVQPLLGPNYVLQPNMSELAVRPNRTPEAIELYTTGVISRGEARLASGYPEDFPDGEEPDTALTSGSSRDLPAQGPPEQPSPDEEFAIADMLAMDVMSMGGGWLLRHTGRENRPLLEPVPAIQRHVVCTSGGDVLEEVLPRVRAKYDESRVSPKIFSAVADYVHDLYESRALYEPAALKRRVCSGG